MGLGLFVWWLVVWDALLLLLFCWIGVDLFGDCLIGVGVCFVFVMFVGDTFGFGLVWCFFIVFALLIWLDWLFGLLYAWMGLFDRIGGWFVVVVCAVGDFKLRLLVRLDGVEGFVVGYCLLRCVRLGWCCLIRGLLVVLLVVCFVF